MAKWWDKSWNPLYGCTKCSSGCENCFAIKNLIKQKRPTEPSFNKKVFKEDLGKGYNYAVCSLGDLFHEKHRYEDIDNVFYKMLDFPENRYFILTKRTEEMKEYFSYDGFNNISPSMMEKIWLGVTVEDNASKKRIQDLLETSLIRHRFLCLEPLLEEVSIKDYLRSEKIEWVIIGAESAEKPRITKNEWITKIIQECREYNVPVYVEQCYVDGQLAVDSVDFPKELQVREFPWIKSTESREVTVMNGNGAVRYKDNEFIFKSPEYVMNCWLRNFDGIVSWKREYPLKFTQINENGRIRNIMNSVREFVSRAHNELIQAGVSQEKADMIKDH